MGEYVNWKDICVNYWAQEAHSDGGYYVPPSGMITRKVTNGLNLLNEYSVFSGVY